MRSIITILALLIILFLCLSIFRHGFPVIPEIPTHLILLAIVVIISVCLALQGILVTGCLMQLLLLALIFMLLMEIFPGMAHYFHPHGLVRIRHFFCL